MDSVRNITGINAKQAPKVTVKDVAEQLGSAALTFFRLLFYITEYAISSVYRFFASEKAAYLAGRYKKFLGGAGALALIFVAVGIIGGMEAGLISLAVGAPVFLIICGAVKLLSNE